MTKRATAATSWAADIVAGQQAQADQQRQAEAGAEQAQMALRALVNRDAPGFLDDICEVVHAAVKDANRATGQPVLQALRYERGGLTVRHSGDGSCWSLWPDFADEQDARPGLRLTTTAGTMLRLFRNLPFAEHHAQLALRIDEDLFTADGTARQLLAPWLHSVGLVAGR